MKCPICGKKVSTWKSLLGGRAVEWHAPKRGAKTPVYGGERVNGQCIYSGTVLNEPR